MDSTVQFSSGNMESVWFHLDMSISLQSEFFPVEKYKLNNLTVLVLSSSGNVNLSFFQWKNTSLTQMYSFSPFFPVEMLNLSLFPVEKYKLNRN